MIAAALITFALFALAVQMVSAGLFLIRLRRSGKPSGALIGQPRVTLLRPVCGLDPQDEATLGSSFGLDYPDYEIIFCAPSDSDASLPLLRRLIAEHPGQRAQILTGETAISGNPKLNNLYKGWRAASSDWVCMTDSNLLLPKDYLAQIVGSWSHDTGLVSAPPVGIAPQGLAGSLECAFLNGNQARLQYASASLGHAFAQGKTLFWNRALLHRAGGLAALGQYLAEDVNATKLVRGMGLGVALAPLPFAQPIGRRSFGAVWSRQLRWSRVRRDGFPLLFAAEIANGPFLPLVALVAAGAGWGGLCGFVALWYGSEIILMRRAGWPCGLRDIAALPLRDLLLPAIWCATFLRRGIEWRGTAMDRPQTGPQGGDPQLGGRPIAEMPAP